MEKTNRITISLPAPLLEAMDAKLARAEESRSAIVRRLVEEALRAAKEREDVQRWVRSYREQPQTEEELGWLDQVVPQALAEQPYE